MPDRTRPDDLIKEALDLIKEDKGLGPVVKIPETFESEEWRHLHRILEWGGLNEKESLFIIVVAALRLFSSASASDEDLRSLLKYPNPSQLKKRTLGKLARYYSVQGGSDPVRVTIPKGFKVQFDRPGEQARDFDQEVAENWLNAQSKEIRRRLAIPPGDIFKPCQPGAGQTIAGPVPIICTLIKTPDKNILLLPSAGPQCDREGLGRTAMLVSMLGLSMPYLPLMTCDGRRAPPDPISIGANKRTSLDQLHLLVADRAYLSVRANGSLVVIPMAGEPIDFMWDCARHLYRSTRVDYISGMHSTPPHRQELLRLFALLKPDPDVIGRYAIWQQSHHVNEIVIVELNHEGRTDTYLTEVAQKLTREEIASGLQFTANHPARFWAEPARRQAVLDFIDRFRHPKSIPFGPDIPVKKLLIEHESALFSHELFFDAAEVLRHGRVTDKPPRQEKINPKGVSAHNRDIIDALQLGKEVTVLATSGAKLLGDRDFWRALQLGADHNARFQLLLLNPEHAPGVQSREKAYDDLRAGFLVDEIRDAVELVRQMRKELSLGPSQLSLKLYERSPEFKIACINRERLLVASYAPTRRTNGETVFQTIEANGPGAPLFDGFITYLDNIWSSSGKEI